MQQNRDTEKDTHLWLINFQKNTKIMQWGIVIISTNGAEKLATHMQKVNLKMVPQKVRHEIILL